MKFKRILSVLMATICLCIGFGSTAYAEETNAYISNEVVPAYEIAKNPSSVLTIKIAAVAMAGVMATSLAMSVSAGTTYCDHFGKVSTRELEPHYTYQTHQSSLGGTCTITTKYRTIVTVCASCGILASTPITEVSHSDSSCTNR